MAYVLVYNQSNLRDLQYFENSIQESVARLPYVAGQTTIDDLVNVVDASTERIGFVFHNDGNRMIPPFFEEQEPTGLSEEIFDIIDASNNYQNNIFSHGFRDAVRRVREKVGHSLTFDLLSCKLDFEDIATGVSRFENDYDINITQSLNDTGNPPNGDWIMESDNIDVKPFQFNTNISAWNHVLTSKIDSNNFEDVENLTYNPGTGVWSLTGPVIWSSNGSLSNLTDGSSLSYIELGPNETFNGDGQTITVPGGEQTSGIFKHTASVSNSGTAPLISNVKIINISGLESEYKSILLTNTVKHIRVEKVEIRGDINRKFCGAFSQSPGLSNGTGQFRNISYFQIRETDDLLNYDWWPSGFISGQYFCRNGNGYVENAYVGVTGEGLKTKFGVFGGRIGGTGGTVFLKNIHFYDPNPRNSNTFSYAILGNSPSTTLYFSNIIFDGKNSDSQRGALSGFYGYGGSNGTCYMNNIILGSNVSKSITLHNSELFGQNYKLYMNNIYMLNPSISNFFESVRNPLNFSVFEVDGVEIRPNYNSNVTSNLLVRPISEITNQIDTASQYKDTYADASGNANGFESNDWIVGTADTGSFPRLKALTENPWDPEAYGNFTELATLNFAYIAPDVIITTENLSAIQSLSFTAEKTSRLEFNSGTAPKSRGIKNLSIRANPLSSANINFTVNSTPPSFTGNIKGTGLGFDISANLEDFENNSIDITVEYDSSILSTLGITEADLIKIRMFHYNSVASEWENVPTSVNTENNTVTGTFTTLSPVDLGVILNQGQFIQKTDKPVIVSLNGAITVKNTIQ